MRIDTQISIVILKEDFIFRVKQSREKKNAMYWSIWFDSPEDLNIQVCRMMANCRNM